LFFLFIFRNSFIILPAGQIHRNLGQRPGNCTIANLFPVGEPQYFFK